MSTKAVSRKSTSEASTASEQSALLQARQRKPAVERNSGYRARQPSLFESRHIDNDREATKLKSEWRKLKRRTHGGSVDQGRRKESRPLDKKKWTHLILKSEKAKGALGFLRPKNQLFITNLINEKAQKFGVKIQSFANVGNHLHLKLKFSNRENFQNFLRSVTTLIARFVTGARKGKPFGRFWDALAYTRVVTTKKDELQLRGYIEANRIEAGSSKSQRKIYLSNFNAWLAKLGKNGGP